MTAQRSSHAIDFVIEEARLVDDGLYEQWLALFSQTGHYWIPSFAAQTDPLTEPSLAYEDTLMLRIRIDRLSHPQAHSQHPASRCCHVLQTPVLVSYEGDDYTLRTPFIYTEQRGATQIQLTGVAQHHLRQIDGTLQIERKRVDLLGADQALPMIQLFP